MNIACVMAALAIEDLDHMAKSAVLVLACRADRYSATALVPTGRVAADMGVHYDTARRALRRAEKAGYLAVETRVDGTPRWRLALAVCAGPPSRSLPGPYLYLNF